VIAIGGTFEARSAGPVAAGAPRFEAPWGCASEDDCLFARGYADAGGNIAHLRHLLQDVRPCEGEWRTVYTNGYVSAFQFTPGSWATAARATGMPDPLDPYQVGVNVAWWIQHIIDPGSSDGWPTCWWRGLAP
jgi:hypothetical protein